jgi:DNA-binding CsgD family transcriptional regulator
MDEGLLEREREIAELERALDEAEDGRGRILLIEGPPGIGKSRLLREVRERAARRMTCLTARCSELERDFAFGAVRQLFEAQALDRARRKVLLAGAAAPAAGVLEGTAGDGSSAEGAFAVLHALYWATLNLAEERPLLLALDDLHWCDGPSLRFAAYLSHRLEGVPVLLAATVRSTDPGTDAALLAEIAADPLTRPVRPGPLGDGAVGALVVSRLGAEPDPGFRAACKEATGGNPLLLGHLLAALEQDGVQPTAGAAAAVHEIGPGAVSRTVLLRLSRLSRAAVAVARAVAVLGESSALPRVAALTGLDEAAVASAAAELSRADILRPEPPLGFVHPLVREAVYGDVPGGERELQHDRAGRVLADAGASEEEIAAQLLHAPPKAEPATVELLRSAARRASRQGGPESAVAYLARALSEPPEDDLRGHVLFELGVTEAEMSAPAAAEHLREAYERLADPAKRAAAAFARGQALMFMGRPREGGSLARETIAGLPSDLADERHALEALELLAIFFGSPDREPLAQLPETAPGDGPGARHLTALAAFALAATGGPAERCEALALEALAGRELVAAGAGIFWSAVLAALFLADSPRLPEMAQRGREDAYRHGSYLFTGSIEVWSGNYLLRDGELDDAAETLRLGRRLQDPWTSVPMGTAWVRGLLAYCEFVRGDRQAAQAALAGGAPSPDDESDGANFWRRAHAELLLADGAAEEALAVADLMGRSAPHVVHPDWKPWRSLRARALALLGRDDEALASMTAELELAYRSGAASTIGRCLRQLGELEREEGIDRLREAVDLLSGASSRLEHARALGALGSALRRARRPTEAREPLRQALELADACGCIPLVDSVRSELHAAGARPRTTALGGVESLTAREARVAELAAEGRTNRDIAQALFVTPKTVEVHLSNVYRKLGIRSRRELARALQGA